MHLLLRWLLSALALYITVLLGKALHLPFYVAPGLAGVAGVLVMTAVLAVVNAILRPLVQAIALPLTCLTFGLFGLVINALMFWLAGQVLPSYFHVAGWVAPLFGSVVMGLVSGVLNTTLISDREKKRERR